VFRGLRPRPGGAARRAPAGPLLAALGGSAAGSRSRGSRQPGGRATGASGGSCICQDEAVTLVLG
jgi:hypothetical protein